MSLVTGARSRGVRAGGGWPALFYTLRLAWRVGFFRLWQAMRSRNACKTCALGMGGQKGGMVNELGRWPEVCKKSMQAMVADMQGAIQSAFFSRYSIHELRAMSSRELEHAGRLTEPMWRSADAKHYEAISWDRAYQLIAERLRATQPDRSFFYVSGRSSNEAGFLLNLLARKFGTNHVNNCSYFCHQASGVGLSGAIGSGTATIRADDLEQCDLYFLIGGNPASNHPRLMTHLMHLKRRGGKVIVINPIRERGLAEFRIPSDPRSLLFGSKIADEFVQVRIGGDIALMMGIAKVLVERDQVDQTYVGNHTENWPALLEVIQQTSWESICQESGISQQHIERLAHMYQQSQRAVFGWTMGITHHAHGVENVQWIVNLALMRGMVGKPGAGLMPIRGHSNVQGMGTIGVVPQLKPKLAENIERLGIKVPARHGYDTLASLEAAHRGEVDLAFALGGNLFGSAPDANFAAEALERIGLLVYLNTTLNTGHVHGLGKETLVLPVLPRDEEPYLSTQESMFNYVRVSDGGPARLPGPRAEVEILASIGARLFGQDATLGHHHWGRLSAQAIRELMAETVPGMAAVITAGEDKQEFEIPGRVLSQPSFATPTKRAKFHAHGLPTTVQVDDEELALMTIRSEGQFNTVVYEEEDIYRGQTERHVVLMNPADLQKRSLREDQLVTVRSSVGHMASVRVRAFPEIRPGCAAMYYPEANQLVPRYADPHSRTPAYKAIPVKVQPDTLLAAGAAGGRRWRWRRPHWLRKKRGLNAC